MSVVYPYVDLVPEDDVIGALEAQQKELAMLLRPLSEEKAGHRYAEGKWSIREVVGHITDTERVFAYRLLTFARGGDQPQPGFDEKMFAANGGYDAQPFGDLLDGFDAVRTSSLFLLRQLPPEAWDRGGVANNKPIDVRTLARMMAGHARHHTKILRERYFGERTSGPQ